MRAAVRAWLVLAVAVGEEVAWGSGNSCPSGYEKLTTVEACRAALDYVGVANDEFQDEEDERDWPSGCYYCDDTRECSDGVWFNTHDSGSAFDTAKPICGQVGWETSLGVATETVFVGDSDVDYWPKTHVLAPSSVNVGYGGYTCKEVRNELDAMLHVFGNPATVVVVCGENDLAYGRSVDKTFGFFTEVVDQAIANGAQRVVYLGTKPEPSTTDLHAEYRTYDSKIRDMVSERAGPLVMIDVYPAFQEVGNPDSLYANDKLHLSDEGYSYWDQWLSTALADTSGCLRWEAGVCVEGGDDEAATPTVAPTPRPTVAPTPRPTVAPTHSPTADEEGGDDESSEVCVDDAAWYKKGNPKKHCDWVANYLPKRCVTKDDDGVYAFERCAATCGTCGHYCADSAEWHAGDDPEDNCRWVRYNFNRCAKKSNDGVYAFEACRRTCQTCDPTVCGAS